MPGTSTLAVEISHVSQHGLWVLLDAEELFLPFEQPEARASESAPRPPHTVAAPGKWCQPPNLGNIAASPIVVAGIFFRRGCRR